MGCGGAEKVLRSLKTLCTGLTHSSCAALLSLSPLPRLTHKQHEHTHARSHRVYADGKVEYLHPKDGVYPEKVNQGRPGVNQNMRSIGKNVDPIKVCVLSVVVVFVGEGEGSGSGTRARVHAQSCSSVHNAPPPLLKDVCWSVQSMSVAEQRC